VNTEGSYRCLIWRYYPRICPKKRGNTKSRQSQFLTFWPQFEPAVFQMEVRILTIFASVSQPLINRGTPKINFRIPSNPYLMRKPLQTRKIW